MDWIGLKWCVLQLFRLSENQLTKMEKVFHSNRAVTFNLNAYFRLKLNFKCFRQYQIHTRINQPTHPTTFAVCSHLDVHYACDASVRHCSIFRTWTGGCASIGCEIIVRTGFSIVFRATTWAFGILSEGAHFRLFHRCILIHNERLHESV